MKRILFFVFLCWACLTVGAQTLAPVTWTAYGLTFQAPKGILVEEDTEETFLLNNSKFYITVQSLDSDGMTKADLKSVLKDYANDDGVKEQSELQEFELSQFYGTCLKGICEEDRCLYACLMTKEAGSAFYVSIIYGEGEENETEGILKSFVMEE
ncbi:hypothetical protein [Phocaeicola sp.]|uniref:hypothetical protein n=1 Tax=Phocaeicola sp. TaxID=2773926 RepID=UPI0023D1E7DE|nr:hypothetical protein [Phocaeicola sp.]MDE5677493.1 hypothetical protein [Phocaeicola sp.]